MNKATFLKTEKADVLVLPFTFTPVIIVFHQCSPLTLSPKNPENKYLCQKLRKLLDAMLWKGKHEDWSEVNQTISSGNIVLFGLPNVSHFDMDSSVLLEAV